ncbi:hypothetical protein [Thermogutta sp.]|uniref:hypothetical protein n=1 Tax=Thermogutta sp. TaxID=1962930 RepID=UPI00321FA958
MHRLMCNLFLVLAVVWPGGQLISGSELKLEKSGNAVAITADGAADINVVPMGDGRWAIVLAVGDPPRVEIVYLAVQPGPGPAPPRPEIPEAQRLAWEWLSSVSEQARNRAGALADAFRSVAERIEKGELTDPGSIIQASTQANRAALGEDRNAWLPWFERLREYMNGLAEKERLKKAADHAVLFRQIADGLDKKP